MTHNLCTNAMEMNIVPRVHSLLIRTCKLADVNYATVLDKNGASIYDGEIMETTFSEKAILKRYRYKQTKLWQIPLKPKVTKETQKQYS